MTNRVEITADSLAPMLAQKFTPRMTFLLHMEFERVELGRPWSGIGRVRIVGADSPLNTGWPIDERVL